MFRMENKYYSNYGTIEEQQKALYYNYMEACIVDDQKTPVIKDHNVTFEINRVNIITEIFSDVKKFCLDTFKNPESHIEKIFECRLSRHYAEIFSNVVYRKHEIYYDDILISLSKIFESVESIKSWSPEYKNFEYHAQIIESVYAPIVSQTENIRLLNLRENFEELIEYRRLWIIRIHLKLRELHKNPLYVARALLIGKKRQYKNFLESVEKYHLRDTNIKMSKTADIAKKLEVSHKGHNVKKQILWLQYTMADNNIPKIDRQLSRYENAIKLNEDYQAIMQQIKDLREENKLFQRQKKQYEQIFSPYKIFQNVAAWECMDKRHKIILAYPKITLG